MNNIVERWTTPAGGSKALRADGGILKRTLEGKWVRYGRLKDGVTVEEYLHRLHELAAQGRVFLGEQAPSIKELEQVLLDAENATTPDGCEVEPDGTCPHGHKSWLVLWGMI